MGDRRTLSTLFIQENGWGQAQRGPLADDASFRTYDRLSHNQSSAILMDAPPVFEDVRPFVAVANYLRNGGLCAPEVIASDIDNGFLLLEDMGNDLFAQVIQNDPAQEEPLYRLAVDGLIHLHQSRPPESLPVKDKIQHVLPCYDLNLLLQEASLFTDWYVPALKGTPLSDQNRAAFLDLWRPILSLVSENLDCLTLRDYHAENLMVRQGEKGLSRLGLLDFQDAVIGHRAYDLVSLLQDARRDVCPDLEQDMVDYYIQSTGLDGDIFRRDYALLGAQRNTKIIGIFTRLYLRDGKSVYLDKISRVWALLDRDLTHPALASIKGWMNSHIDPALKTAEFKPTPFMPQKAMVLAAGMGTRMRPLTTHCPKPLIKVLDKELLSHSLDGLCAAGVRNVVVNMHYLADQIEDFVGSYYDHRVTVTLSDEKAQLLDSGGGVKRALPILGAEPFLLLNSDMIWQDGTCQMLPRLQAFWQADDMDILMLLIPRDKAVGFDGVGDYHRDEAGRLAARGQAAQADFVYGGILIIKPECFDGVTEDVFSLRRQFDQAEQNGRLFGVIHDGGWYHVGTPEAITETETLLQEARP